jgi:hypothetical protein
MIVLKNIVLYNDLKIDKEVINFCLQIMIWSW